MKILRTLIVLASAAIFLNALAAPPTNKTVAPKTATNAPAAKGLTAKSPPAKAPSAPALPPLYRPEPDRVISDAWYTVTVQPKIRYAYYNDRVEIRQGKLFYQNHFWKQEEGYLNEEQLGAFAENDHTLKPLFFNFHSTYRTTEMKIDGTVKDGKVLTVKVNKGGTDLPVITRGLGTGTILSVFFPVWLAARLPVLKPEQTVSFLSILEDNVELSYSPVSGQVRLEKPDVLASKTGTTRLSINYRDMRSTWYVDKGGVPVRIEMPAQKTVIEKVTQQAAQNFLEE